MPEQQDVQSNDTINQLIEVLKQFPDSPSQAKIDEWKATFGEVFVSAFSETEVYLWRTIKRPEYVQMQILIQDPKLEIDNFKLEEMICDTCLLWTSVKQSWSEGKAGTPNLLSEQIMTNSHFLPPSVASQLVAKL
jgi:hypothetical protein